MRTRTPRSNGNDNDGAWQLSGGELGWGCGVVSSSGYPWISTKTHSPNPNTPPQTPPETTPQHPHQTTPASPYAARSSRLKPTGRMLQIGRWGNVLAVRLPQALSELLHFQQGDTLQLQVLSNGALLLIPSRRSSQIALAGHLQRLQEQDRQVRP